MSARTLNAHHAEMGRVAFERQRVSRGEWDAVVRFYNFLDLAEAGWDGACPTRPGIDGAMPSSGTDGGIDGAMPSKFTKPPSTTLTTHSTLDPNEYHLPDPHDADEMCVDCEFFRTAAEAGRRAAEDYLAEERAVRMERVLDVVTVCIVVLFLLGAVGVVMGGLWLL